MTQEQLSEAIKREGGGCTQRTVTNVETGTTAVMDQSRPAWEHVLKWSSGSLTAAYKRGQRPTAPVASMSLRDAEEHRALGEAEMPLESVTHKELRDLADEVRDVVDSDLPAEAKVRVLQAWSTAYHARQAFVQMYVQERRCRASHGQR